MIKRERGKLCLVTDDVYYCTFLSVHPKNRDLKFRWAYNSRAWHPGYIPVHLFVTQSERSLINNLGSVNSFSNRWPKSGQGVGERSEAPIGDGSDKHDIKVEVKAEVAETKSPPEKEMTSQFLYESGMKLVTSSGLNELRKAVQLLREAA